MEIEKKEIVKDKSRLAIKLFILVWVVLLVHVILKLTFNYWQPYVIPNDKLQIISDFIDSNLLLKLILNKILWFVGTYFMILASIQKWKFKKKYPIFILIICGIVSLISNYTPFNEIMDTIITIFTLIGLPLIINIKKWFPTIIVFALNFIFLALSLWLEGIVSSDNMPYICKVFLEFDYYIMLIICYFVFNLIRKKE